MVFSQKLVKRYKELKQEVPDYLLLMQVGAFMQVMDEDARAVSKVTGLKLQMAGDVDAPVVLGDSRLVQSLRLNQSENAHNLED